MNCQHTLSLGFSGYNNQRANRQPHANRDSASARHTATVETTTPEISTTDATIADITMVERVLAVFFGGMATLFGTEPAAVSEEDWLHELMAINDLPTSTCRWRLLDIDAIA